MVPIIASVLVLKVLLIICLADHTYIVVQSFSDFVVSL